MGTKLILKNADFSEHRIETEMLLIGTTAQFSASNDYSKPEYCPFWQLNWDDFLTGKTVTSIELKVHTPGIITVGVTSEIETNPTILRSTQINFTQEGEIQKLPLPTPITIASGEHFFIQASTDTGLFSYINGGLESSVPGFYSISGSSVYTNKGADLLVNVYGN